MIRPAAANIAWAAFDDAALRLNLAYRKVDLHTDTATDRAQRMTLAIETARLWDEWRKLFLGGESGDAA